MSSLFQEAKAFDEPHRAECGAASDGDVIDDDALPCMEIFNAGRYRATVVDLEFIWRWRIQRDGEFVQEGCSLSEASSREAVGHVMAYYAVRDASAADSGGPAS